ncbi:GNAT family N-acetyltransferase [Brevibacillus sp. HB1.1]|uniref:GNAT family N-acetyltransferase n=1 Tax=Brevibacillus sp. HB1.1 TaxID=2738808 RepID=UPI001575BE0C|nr:GNAT family N-acetyltransferase [Brevibacillus sp. HB1.1]NTU29641.1 GNAT family N-acetyltransferase [Brevibacillus sp. HB1.1]
MTGSPITIEPMHSTYNQQIGQLLVHGFRGKFQTLTKLNDGELAIFFEKLFDHVPTDRASQRMVALQEGEVIGTISIKWKTEFDSRRIFPAWKNFYRFGRWNLLKMFIGLSFLDHKPQAGECYITDVVVHPNHQGKGVGNLLLHWAHNFAQAQPSLDKLSLYVAGKNPRAEQLYQRLSFHTQLRESSFLSHLLFKEKKWSYMVKRLK